MKNAVKKNFRPIAIRPNELEVEAEWWIESVAFIEQQEKESLRQSVRGKGISMCDPVFEEKEARTNADSKKLDMILNMMKQYFSGKRKCSSEEEELTQPPNDHDEVEGMVFRNDNINNFDVKAAETPGPSVEVVERPKRTKKPSSTFTRKSNVSKTMFLM
ncbi:hypothetical protein L1987_55012 [Smallanthus sonchifolius]|uniref:Uncharacterized protein n=1 Tax=Smallanthus sonchifolius TaxID=185202 RepID=A0ACB9E9T3_9ASTR|nr:hypothetical protein L1987_55012 [Smallanthus sonchifolius]